MGLSLSPAFMHCSKALSGSDSFILSSLWLHDHITVPDKKSLFFFNYLFVLFFKCISNSLVWYKSLTRPHVAQHIQMEQMSQPLHCLPEPLPPCPSWTEEAKNWPDIPRTASHYLWLESPTSCNVDHGGLPYSQWEDTAKLDDEISVTWKFTFKILCTSTLFFLQIFVALHLYSLAKIRFIVHDLQTCFLPGTCNIYYYFDL